MMISSSSCISATLGRLFYLYPGNTVIGCVTNAKQYGAEQGSRNLIVIWRYELKVHAAAAADTLGRANKYAAAAWVCWCAWKGAEIPKGVLGLTAVTQADVVAVALSWACR